MLPSLAHDSHRLVILFVVAYLAVSVYICVSMCCRICYRPPNSSNKANTNNNGMKTHTRKQKQKNIANIAGRQARAGTCKPKQAKTKAAAAGRQTT